jgi:hypothetical protein
MDNFSTNSITVRKALSEFRLPDEVVEVILGYFSSMVVGEDKAFIAPIFQDLEVEEIREVFQNISINHEPDWIREWSSEEWAKLKPRSDVPGYPQWAPQLAEAMANTPEWSIDESLRSQAFDYVVDKAIKRRHCLRPCSFDTALRGMDLTTNSGVFYFTRRSKVVAERYDELVGEARACLNHDSPYNSYYIGGRRAKEGKGSEPTGARPISMAAMPANLAAATYQRPLLDMMRSCDWFPSMSGPMQDQARLRLLLENSHVPLLSGDITGFDSSVHSAKLAEFEEFLKLAFQPSRSFEIEAVSDQMRSSEILWPDRVFSPIHFITSGATMTNMADSVINAIDIVYNLIVLGVPVTDIDFIVNGDDFVTKLPVPFDDYARVSATHGMNLHPDKQVITGQGVDFAAFNASVMRRGDWRYLRSVARLARSLAFPERIPALGELGQSLRLITILHLMEEHDAYWPILELIYHRDRIKLGYGNPKIVSDSTIRIVNEGLGYDKPNVPKALTLKGLKAWRILSDIKTLGDGSA